MWIGDIKKPKYIVSQNVHKVDKFSTGKPHQSEAKHFWVFNGSATNILNFCCSVKVERWNESYVDFHVFALGFSSLDISSHNLRSC